MVRETDANLIEVGRVRKFEVGCEDHGIFGFNIEVDFGGSMQGTGWYSLEGPNGARTLKRWLDFFNVNRFESIVGRIVEVHRDEPFGIIVGLGIPKFDIQHHSRNSFTLLQGEKGIFENEDWTP